MNSTLTPIGEEFRKQLLLDYHILEEVFIGIICLVIALRAYTTIKDKDILQIQKARAFLFLSAFLLLGISSGVHAAIHTLKLHLNLLYQTLLGYCFGLLLLISALSSVKPERLRLLPFIYLFLTLLFLPSVYENMPYFDEFRPLVWILIAYLSGIVCMIYIGTCYRTHNKHFLFSAVGHLFICLGAMFLFFPSRIGSSMWLYGHLFRPVGFLMLLFSVTKREIESIGGSILYRSLAAFSLLAGIPLVVFGSVIFYENINPVRILSKKMILFILFIVTLISALLFGLGLVIRLIRPIIALRASVEELIESGFQKKLSVHGPEEVVQLAKAFNDMVEKLNLLIEERDRLSRLSATVQFSATIAHEIKNPLNAISGAVSYLRKNFQGELIREFLDIIAEEVKRINKLVTSFLSFSRPLRLERQWTDINKLIHETVSLMEHEVAESGVVLKVELSPDLPEVYCDPNQVKQVMINLILNALDATDGNGEIMIRTEKESSHLVVSVIDNGSGIPADLLPEIFNPFFTTKTRGTGLGLTISKSIAKEHGGDILVESSPLKGSTFKVLLPLGGVV